MTNIVGLSLAGRSFIRNAEIQTQRREPVEERGVLIGMSFAFSRGVRERDHLVQIPSGCEKCCEKLKILWLNRP